MAKKEKHVEEPVTEQDVTPTAEYDTEVSRDSYSIPEYPNTAASDAEPKEPTRPETKQERRDRRIAEVEAANASE